jgi:hypothetical protein
MFVCGALNDAVSSADLMAFSGEMKGVRKRP